MINPILIEPEQREAYEHGYRHGTLVKFMMIKVSEFTLGKDFPLGSWAQQFAQGYKDAVYGEQPRFVKWNGGRTNVFV